MNSETIAAIRTRIAAADLRMTAATTTVEAFGEYLFYWLSSTFCSAEITTEAAASSEACSNPEKQA